MLRRALAAGAVAAALLLTACNGDDPGGPASATSSPAATHPTVAADFCDKELFAPVLALDDEPSVPDGSIADKSAETPPNYTANCTASLLAEQGQTYLQIAWFPDSSADDTRAVVQDRVDQGAEPSAVDGEGWEYAALLTTVNGDELGVDLLVHHEGVDYYLGASVRDSALTAAEIGDALVEVAHNAEAEVTW